MTVSGLTMTRTSDHRDQKRRRVVQMSRSREFSLGRGRFRLSTATCCLRARTSRAVSRRLAEEDTDHGEDGEDEFRHELTLVTRCTVAREQASGSNCKVLISKPRGVSATHRPQKWPKLAQLGRS